MGICQSTGAATATIHQPSAGNIKSHPETTNDGAPPRPKCRVNSINESSVTSSTTGMTAAVSFLRSGEECPIPEEQPLVDSDRHHQHTVPDEIAALL